MRIYFSEDLRKERFWPREQSEEAIRHKLGERFEAVCEGRFWINEVDESKTDDPCNCFVDCENLGAALAMVTIENSPFLNEEILDRISPLVNDKFSAAYGALSIDFLSFGTDVKKPLRGKETFLPAHSKFIQREVSNTKVFDGDETDSEDEPDSGNKPDSENEQDSKDEPQNLEQPNSSNVTEPEKQNSQTSAVCTNNPAPTLTFSGANRLSEENFAEISLEKMLYEQKELPLTLKDINSNLTTESSIFSDSNSSGEGITNNPSSNWGIDSDKFRRTLNDVIDSLASSPSSTASNSGEEMPNISLPNWNIDPNILSSIIKDLFAKHSPTSSRLSSNSGEDITNNPCPNRYFDPNAFKRIVTDLVDSLASSPSSSNASNSDDPNVLSSTQKDVPEHLSPSSSDVSNVTNLSEEKIANISPRKILSGKGEAGQPNDERAHEMEINRAASKRKRPDNENPLQDVQPNPPIKKKDGDATSASTEQTAKDPNLQSGNNQAVQSCEEETELKKSPREGPSS